MSCMPELCLDALDEDFLTLKKHFVLNCLPSFLSQTLTNVLFHYLACF